MCDERHEYNIKIATKWVSQFRAKVTSSKCQRKFFFWFGGVVYDVSILCWVRVQRATSWNVRTLLRTSHPVWRAVSSKGNRKKTKKIRKFLTSSTWKKVYRKFLPAAFWYCHHVCHHVSFQNLNFLFLHGTLSLARRRRLRPKIQMRRRG